MQHTIEIVEDDQMPKGQDFLLVVVGAHVLITYRASVIRGPSEQAARMLGDSWAAYRALERELLAA